MRWQYENKDKKTSVLVPSFQRVLLAVADELIRTCAKVAFVLEV
jgi:hypothetical protein